MGEFSVYSGMPGPILFLLELSKITGDISWREEACLAADYLLANFDEGRKMQTDMGGSGFRDRADQRNGGAKLRIHRARKGDGRTEVPGFCRGGD